MAETKPQSFPTSERTPQGDDSERAAAPSSLASVVHTDFTSHQHPAQSQIEHAPLSTDTWGDQLKDIRQKDQARGGGIPQNLRDHYITDRRPGQLGHEAHASPGRIIRDYEDAVAERFLSCYFLDGDITRLRMTMEGPPSSPFRGGIFHLLLTLEDYPYRPPGFKFITRIYHPNVDDQGEMCIDILGGEWSPFLSLVKLLLSVSSVLSDPMIRDPLVPEIAEKYVYARGEYNRVARETTLKYATPHQNLPEYGIGE